ncbi:MAG: hypothetical protein TR69_WS6001001430 [candidate division WS6 bacterium OLB20]|uniref:Uncharacterized protein n=1 Tax=candidate division WS6 bacterium OLB20 TaxID=1617426 RepID=A0A136LVY0_9BACT|nr:MAG: hypothetical protein TR69_WS6001001430 [candidate division WS6 bacterium OLB20]
MPVVYSSKTVNTDEMIAGYKKSWLIEQKKQPCPQCGGLIGNINGTRDAVCKNCGFKDPCCE